MVPLVWCYIYLGLCILFSTFLKIYIVHEIAFITINAIANNDRKRTGKRMLNS